MNNWQNRIVGHGEVDPTQLLANPRNWRIHPQQQQEALEGVLDDVGWVDEIIVNQRTNFVIDGHLRVAMSISREMPTVPVQWVDLSEEEEALILAVIDPIAGMAVADKEILDDLLAGIHTESDRVQSLLEEVAKRERLHLRDWEPPPRIDAADELQEKWQVQPGQIWRIGDHRLICADCLDPAVIESFFGEERAEMCFTDPPYNVNYGTIKHPRFRMRQIEGDNLPEDEWIAFCRQMAEMIHSITDGCIYVCHAPNQDGRLMAMELDRLFHCSTTIIWAKDRMVMGRGKYQNQYEPIWFGWNKTGKRFTTGNRTLTNLWQISRPGNSEEHPTMKPVELVTNAIFHASQPGDLVFDPFIGSGTTMIAAQHLNRVCYAIEKEPKYCSVTLERMLEMGVSPKVE